MKRIILALTIAAFAVAAQAGEGCSKDKAACGAKSQATACSAKKDQAACATKQASGCCPKSGDLAKSNCPKAQAAKRWLMSPKASGELASAK